LEPGNERIQIALKTMYTSRPTIFAINHGVETGFRPSGIEKVSGHCCPINFIRRLIEIEGLAALVQEDLRVAAPTGPVA